MSQMPWPGGHLDDGLGIRGGAHWMEDAPRIWWWDGSTRQEAYVRGWWDGEAVRPLVIRGWWDGAQLKELVR